MTSPASSTTPTLGIREALAQVVAGRNLSVADMSAVVGCMMDGQATPAQMGSLLTALRMKGETVDEVVGAALAMRQRMVRLSCGRACPARHLRNWRRRIRHGQHIDPGVVHRGRLRGQGGQARQPGALVALRLPRRHRGHGHRPRAHAGDGPALPG